MGGVLRHALRSGCTATEHADGVCAPCHTDPWVSTCIPCRQEMSEGKVQYVPCSPGEKGAFEATLIKLAEDGKAAAVQPPKISMRDFEKVPCVCSSEEVSVCLHVWACLDAHSQQLCCLICSLRLRLLLLCYSAPDPGVLFTLLQVLECIAGLLQCPAPGPHIGDGSASASFTDTAAGPSSS